MSSKPSIPKGTRDFLPVEVQKREYIFNTIKKQFKLFGYKAIETPSMENLSTLMGKYGEEGDKLLFKIINSGDYLNKVSDQDLAEKNSTKLISKISEKGLRYDLTVPFARFVVQHRNDISFPFKRYQIQPVWRADRPQKGRYREFFQCDADVVGSDSLIFDAEYVDMIDKVFRELDINVCVKINNRKILSGIAEIIDEQDKIVDITVAIDKLDKIGLENVNKEILSKGITQEKVDSLQPIINLEGTTEEKIEKLSEILKDSEIGMKGVDELKTIFGYIENFDIKNEVELDLTLARGLNYYTGSIYEVKSLDTKIGSICGGGRYDNLTGIFGLKDVSGVGISFGADRIYDVLKELDKFPKESLDNTQIMFVNFGENEALHCMKLVAELRTENISAELYPSSAKMKKQMQYANNNNVQYVALVGESEITEGVITVKNMETGDQEKLTIYELINKLAK
jgi:histidyl-tRNA synthetase